jgi:hypothetical protein
VRFEVIDQGRGIEPAQQQMIFEKFHQIENTYSKSQPVSVSVWLSPVLWQICWTGRSGCTAYPEKAAHSFLMQVSSLFSHPVLRAIADCSRHRRMCIVQVRLIAAHTFLWRRMK